VDGDRGSLVFELAGPRLQIDSAVLGGGPTEMDLSGVAWHSSLCGPMADLLISIEQDREPLVSARRNLPTIRAVVAEDRSARAGGRWVEC
jgi:predicted dehydrogenase